MEKVIAATIFFFGSILYFNTASGGSVDERTAQSVAVTFFKAHTNTAPGTILSATLIWKQTENDSSVDYYIFNISPISGFVVVGGNYNTVPVIAYSFESNFVYDTNQESGMSDWLNKSAKKIHNAYTQNLSQDQSILRQWNQYLQGNYAPTRSSGIGPLLSTYWNQSKPGNPVGPPFYYNLYCPGSGGQNSLGGCNAIAIAQILNYWQYPVYGTGTNSYTPTGYTLQSVDFGTTSYQWNLMPGQITSSNYASDSALALDTLIYQCGVAVDMEYSPTNSYSYLYGSPSALNAYTAYFGYDPAAQFSLDTMVTEATWLGTIENELNNARVVQYRGYDPMNGSGHIWVCDGYDNSNFLHMNWGWGGQDNGFFQIGALSPGGEAFNTGDMALIDIHPPGRLTGPALGVISQKQTLNSLSVYPNPSTDLLTVEVSSIVSGSDCSMTVYDDLGRVMMVYQNMEVSEGQNSFQINIKPLPTGVYILKLQNASLSITTRFVKTL